MYLVILLLGLYRRGGSVSVFGGVRNSIVRNRGNVGLVWVNLGYIVLSENIKF